MAQPPTAGTSPPAADSIGLESLAAEVVALAVRGGASDAESMAREGDVYSLDGQERIEWARRAEAAALATDPRITNSDGGWFDAVTGRKKQGCNGNPA